ncbi:MAG: 4-hydroxythreonine-4-phosphate dehydrogenase PdxA [Flavobacteriaceae bacterium]|jgi:4-hydroxythreonine-4-phosphate dehydrogenase|nr:4-hydroxythreonine-4-phosphate dehydrogenase PdxA [Flavobacteriaceae bacterium]MBT3753916.1 4-hydroxythreonine-4-phosphate dehydrogenase PdxA [Flavobacteriaceae bacterium]MBT3794589.1 4-hydroxythreonine-4-phosphate dehydrogenase PdxA [Flavobacteriaceae bacterium]MBT4062501.1 4-hydroxythreonine-4-phosphate dehydrogenase PdxA [Flavobacteriaceae bacterium]MBT4414959.1 4-hydroxythreonine-4-phosphate dehydrogenase PdxA [Flavobacteriaceae bacterium]
MEEKKLPIVGISCGDPNGIGIEIILKALSDNRILDFFIPIIFSNEKLMSDQKKKLNIDIQFSKINFNKKPLKGKINIINVWEELYETEFGKPTIKSGELSFKSLEAVTKALINNQVDVMVTAPINKNNIQSKDFNFPGHTDYLAKKLQGESLMFMLNENLRVGLLTDHIPIKEIASNVSLKKVKEKVLIMEQSLKIDFGVQKPKIAVLSVNPHVGDGGVIGNEDDSILKPALIEISKEGTMLFGPFSADSFFGSGNYKKYDAILAIYHDQGLVPFKTLSFGEGVNFTAGLNKIRTSPDHGTGYDIAGKDLADSNSFKNAIFSAIEIFNKRKLHKKITENPLLFSKDKTFIK